MVLGSGGETATRQAAPRPWRGTCQIPTGTPKTIETFVKRRVPLDGEAGPRSASATDDRHLVRATVDQNHWKTDCKNNVLASGGETAERQAAPRSRRVLSEQPTYRMNEIETEQKRRKTETRRFDAVQKS